MTCWCRYWEKLESVQIAQGRRLNCEEVYKTWANEDEQYVADLHSSPNSKERIVGSILSRLTMVNMNTHKGFAFPFKKKTEVPPALDMMRKKLNVKAVVTDQGWS